VALLQSGTPDALQGRVSGLWMIQAMVAPAAGGLQAGALASALSPAAALLIGGAVSIVAAVLISATVPALRRTRIRELED
jgi:ENTS family enterobactin (siderophore) exporter